MIVFIDLLVAWKKDKRKGAQTTMAYFNGPSFSSMIRGYKNCSYKSSNKKIENVIFRSDHPKHLFDNIYFVYDNFYRAKYPINGHWRLNSILPKTNVVYFYQCLGAVPYAGQNTQHRNKLGFIDKIR